VNLKRSLITLTIGYLILIMLVCGMMSFALYRLGSGPLERRLSLRQELLDNPGYMPGDVPPRLASPAVQEVKHRIALFLIYFNIGVLCLAGLVSYGLAKRELKPMEEAFDLQSRFTSDAAHELRTPLTAMKTEIEVALRGGELESAETRDLLQSNLEEIDKLEALSSSLLKLAQYQEGFGAEVGALELPAVLEEAADRVKRSATARGITVEILPRDLTVMGDRTSLVELFVILLDNSIKYSNDNTKITVWTYAQKRNAFVVVKDEGRGISAEDLPHVFDRFYRGQPANAETKVGGHGLGLSIARRIAELHHGAIDLQSEEGKGTTATVHIPLAT